MLRRIEIQVDGPPPAKDGGFSIFNSNHPHHPRVVALRAAIKTAVAGLAPFVNQPLRLEVERRRATCRADALNVINGIADVLQRRPTAESYANEAWVLDDDANVREFSYRETAATADSYVVWVSAIEGNAL